ncbi:hypothetical protein VTN00DRAFT_3176 [Thermoascus crustaceus]|uniref:uncharacterized protein n=1 Tax=Thermoascus crustaceus TaxID=5088 RepID=UPI003742372D
MSTSRGRATPSQPTGGDGKPQKPSQIKFIRPAQMSLFARVTSYPPLGQVTCVEQIQKALKSEDDDKLRFTVVLESSRSFPEQTWEVQIWHNIGNSNNWGALPLKKCPPSFTPMVTGRPIEDSYYRYTFSEEISLPTSGGYARFTVRYRTSSDAQWQWANQQRPVNDGEIVFAPRKPKIDPSATPGREELSKYIDGLASGLDIQPRKSEAPGSILWSISGDVEASKESQSGIRKLTLGTPSSSVRNFSLVRVWSPWLAPRHGKNTFRLTEDAILCSFLRTDGLHLVLLAISGVNDVLTIFQSGEKGEIVIEAKNDNRENSKFQILASVAESFEVANCALVYEARKVVRASQEEATTPTTSKPAVPDSPPGDDIVLVERDPRVQWLSNWYDGLTYCTWNALGQNLTEQKILNALDTLKSNGINIVNLIIDDNWQTLDNAGESQFKRGWRHFEANPEGFPEGLKHTVDAIRQRHPDIEHIAVWHALMGYWGGISPDGELARKYKTKEVIKKDPVAGGTMLAIDPGDIQRFYDDFYSYLTSVGVDAVKTDAQFFLDLLEDPDDRKRFTTAYQDAWSIASLKHFSTRSIACMSLTPQLIFHSYMPTNKPSILLRNSDDFFPDVPESHPWHVFCNAHNALLTRYLNVIPDWDMFQTSHAYASFHAAARSVSGGPIYITDEPGKHDLDIINQMTAPTPRGNTVILRPSVLGRTLDVYHDYNEGNTLRIGTYTGWARTGSGILGLFNISSADVSSLIPLIDFPGIHTDTDGPYIVRAHTSGKITEMMQPKAQNAFIAVSLEPKGWEILTAYPTRSFTLPGSRGCTAGDGLTHVAILGLLGKMTGVAAVASSDIFMVENGRLRFDINLKALGTLGIYLSDLNRKTIDKNFMVTLSGRSVPRKTVWKERGDDSKVLAIDVLAAWKALGLSSGWSNEVVVQVFVS